MADTAAASGGETSGLRHRKGGAEEPPQEESEESQKKRAEEAAALSPYKKSCQDGCDDDHHGLPAHRKKRRDGCMKFFMSPPWKIFVLSVLCSVPGVGITYAMPTILDRRGCEGLWRVFHYGLSWWFTVMFAFNFASSQWRDPGSTKGIKPDFEATGQFAMVLGKNSEKVGDSVKFAPNWCEKCENWKPPRCHHCSFCGRCTLRMDHHCPFTGNCIGFNNHGHFILMYLVAMMGMVYALLISFTEVIRCLFQEEFRLVNLMTRPMQYDLRPLNRLIMSFFLTISDQLGWGILVFCVMSVLATLAVFGFGGPAVYLAFSSVTVLEAKFPMKEYVQIQPSVYCPLGPTFFNWGWKQSLRDIWGPRWWLRMMVPYKGTPDWHVAVSPRPSPLGESALMERLRQVERDGAPEEVKSVEDLGIHPGPRAQAAARKLQQEEDEAQEEEEEEKPQPIQAST